MKWNFCFLIFSAIIAYSFFSCRQQIETTDEQAHLLETFNRSVIENLETANPDSALKLAREVLRIRKSINSDTVVFNAYTQAAIVFDNTGLYDSALLYLEQAYELAKNNNRNPQIARALHLTGGIYMSKQELAPAREYLQKAQAINARSGNQDQLAANYSSLGLVFQMENKYDSALHYYHKAEQMFHSLSDIHNKTIVLGNIAAVYKDMEMHEKSLPIFKKLIRINDSLQNLSELTSNYNRLGLTYLHIKEYDSAIAYFNKSLSLAEQTGLEFDQLIARFNLGRGLSLSGKFTEANTVLEKVYTFCMDNDITDGQVRCLLRLGQNFGEMNQPGKAEELLSRGLQISEENDDQVFIKEFLRELLLLDMQKTGNPELEENFLRLRQVEDSIKKWEHREKVAEFETRYETQKKDHQLNTLAQQNHFQKVRIRFIFIIAVLLLITIVFVIFYYCKRNQILKQMNQLALEKNSLQQANLKQKEQELVFAALTRARVVELFHRLRDEMKPFQFKLKTKTDQKDFIERIETLNKANNIDAMKEFEVLFLELHPKFYQGLSQAYPQLTPRDLQICAMIRLNMTTKDIASVTFHTPGSIDTARYTIRKRMNLTNDQSLVNELMKF